MPASPTYKAIEFGDLTTPLDTRSLPGKAEQGTYRWRQNFSVSSEGKMCRMAGWTRAFHDREPNNWDLHDQLFGNPRQQITMLFEAETNTRFSKVYAGTQNRIYALNNGSGNWKVITTGKGGDPVSGCPERRFRAAQVDDIVMFTNSHDKVFYTLIDQPADANGESVQLVDDLETLAITKVRIILSFGKMMILIGMEEAGEFYANRVRWSDRGAGTSFLPGTSSTANFFDMDDEDAVIGAAKFGNGFYIYTTNGIWEARPGTSDNPLTFVKRWTPDKAKNRTLAYPNTLVSDGQSHFYWGSDGIYRYDQFTPEPELVTWMHMASAQIFDDINKSKCQVHVGGFNGLNHEIWWSWAKNGSSCPEHTMVFNTRYPFASYVDHGFTAYLYHEPDTQYTVRQFIKDYCICPQLSDFEEEGIDFSDENEGNLQCAPEEEPYCYDIPYNWINSEPLYDGDIVTENFTGTPYSGSLFSILGDTTIGDLCDTEYESDFCNAEKTFLMASYYDKTIKEVNYNFRYRMVCTAFIACGLYENVGYKSILRSNPLHFGIRDDDKQINRFGMDASASPESYPSIASARIGMSATPQDANYGTDKCTILWDELDARKFECLDKVNAATHREEGTRPTDEYEWSLWLKARYFYIELTIENPDNADTGGFVCLTRFVLDVAGAKRDYPA